VPSTSGVHAFGATDIGRVRVVIDDEVVVDNWTAPRPGHTFYGFGSTEVRGGVDLEAGRPVRLRVDYARDGGECPAVRVGVLPPQPADLLERAVGAARGADVAIVIVGSTPEWETEGSDRVAFDLPGRQNELVDAVLDVNRNTVVVVNAGSPVAMQWADRCPALVVAWYPGMAFGEALADVLLGDVNPSGRLPTTFPRRLEDHPAYLNYPGEGGRVVYGEGVFAGYRGFDARDIEPLFPFGHGLSYTSFSYGPLRLVAHDASAHTATVAVDVTNTGTRAGAEVVQLYVADHESRVARPPKELRAFTKLVIEPGRTATARFDLGPRAFAFWDPDTDVWAVEPGRFDLLVGSSSRDIRARTTLPW
jgi:beta-glucosidase